MNSADFRKELVKIMPGYNWTVHRADEPDIYIDATGIQSSGFNRLSTMKVKRWGEKFRDGGVVEYEVMSAGNGVNVPWLSSTKNRTLARALRCLQEFYEAMARKYAGAANDMQRARKA